MSRVAYDSEVIQSLLQQITGGFLLQIVQVTAVGVMLFTLNAEAGRLHAHPGAARDLRQLVLLEARSSEALPLLGLQQQAGRHAHRHALRHARREGVRPGRPRVRPIQSHQRPTSAIAAGMSITRPSRSRRRCS